MRILVTNDDGIDSIGLHVLARTMRRFGDVIIAAPDSEYSGYGAAIGSIWHMEPEVHRTQIEGIDEAWSVSAAPALCAMFGRLGAFGDIDLVVSGINPGANVGRSVYHSGTVGACLTARNGGINAVAVSQSIDNWGVEGQGWEAMLANQNWQGAADIAAVVVQQLITDLPDRPGRDQHQCAEPARRGDGRMEAHKSLFRSPTLDSFGIACLQTRTRRHFHR